MSFWSNTFVILLRILIMFAMILAVFAFLCYMACTCRPCHGQQTTPGLHWLPVEGKSHLHALFKDGTQVGVWDTKEGAYYHWNGVYFSQGLCPTHPPVMQNFGVDQRRISPPGGGGARYSIGGKEVTREEALGQVGQLEDDSKKLRLVIIGSEDTRKHVEADLRDHPDLRELTQGLVVQSYAPDHWHVARYGFHTKGSPTIYLLDPEGKVLHRQDDYQGGGNALGKALTRALRRASPDYQPEADPDLRQDAVTRFVPLWPFIVIGAAGLAVYLWPRKELAS